jgi:hypothetical protein
VSSGLALYVQSQFQGYGGTPLVLDRCDFAAPLLDLIGKAMGKSPVAGADLSDPTGEPIDDEDDTDDDTEAVEFAENAKAMPNFQG